MNKTINVNGAYPTTIELDITYPTYITYRNDVLCGGVPVSKIIHDENGIQLYNNNVKVCYIKHLFKVYEINNNTLIIKLGRKVK